MDYLDLARFAIEEAQSHGAFESEAYLLDADSLTIEISEKKLETLKLAKDTGIGLRIISKTGAVGFSYSTDIEKDQIRKLVYQALENSRKSFVDKYHQLPKIQNFNSTMELLDPQLSNVPVEEKIAMTQQAENAAKEMDKRIIKSERCMYQDAQYGVALANSNGLGAYYRAGYCGLYCSVLASENGDTQSGMALSYKRNYNDLNPKNAGMEAAKQALLLLGGRSIKTTKATVVLSPYVASNFLSVLIPSFSADAVHKEKSIFRGKLGQQIISPQINITDDGTLLGGIATAPIDGEGVPTEKTELIVNGVLTRFLYNSYTAAKDGTVSTGNGMRNSFKSVTEIGPTNLFIEAGNIEPDQLVQQTGNGFYVTSVMGLHTANPISGDFSLGAAGIWIKDGKLTHAVRGVAIAGNILDLFSKVEAIGSDLTFFGGQGAPTLRINSITISGE